jgi:hypothetical protein
MAQQSAPIQGMDFHLLNSALLNFGVTPGGAYQFIQGLPVGSQADRDILRGIFSKQPLNESAVRSALLKFGVTPGGANQFMQGLPVLSQADREALRAILLRLTHAPAFSANFVKTDKDKIEPYLQIELENVLVSSY